MWGEIIQWEHKEKDSFWSQCTTATTNAIKKAISNTTSSSPTKLNLNLPASVSRSIKSAIDEGTLQLYVEYSVYNEALRNH